MKPRAGASWTIGPQGSVRRELPDPLEGAQEEERRFFLDGFHGRPLLELLRRLRLAEWNAANWQQVAEGAKQELRQAQERLREVETPPDLSAAPPGWALPGPAADLVELAQAHGWLTRTAWGERSGGDVSVSVQLLFRQGPERVWKFDHLTWVASGKGTSMRRLGSGLASTPEHRGWHDAPSLKRIRALIETGTAPVPVPVVPVGEFGLAGARGEVVGKLIGDVAAATDRDVESLAGTVQARRDHRHPAHEDWFCMNQVSLAGERIAPLIRRLLDAECELARLRGPGRGEGQ